MVPPASAKQTPIVAAPLAPSEVPAAVPAPKAKPALVEQKTPRHFGETRRAVERAIPHRDATLRSRRGVRQVAYARQAPSMRTETPQRFRRQRPTQLAMAMAAERRRRPSDDPPSPSSLTLRQHTPRQDLSIANSSDDAWPAHAIAPSAPQVTSQSASAEINSETAESERPLRVNWPHRMGKSSMASAAATSD